MANRVSKHWNYNVNYKDIKEFNLDEVNKDNLVNMMLYLKQSDVCYDFMMKLFGTFDGKRLVNQYDTFDVPAHWYKFEDKKGKVVSNTSKFTTTFGIWIYNIFFIRDLGFAKFFGYINEEINKDKYEDIEQELVYALAEDKITTEAYKNFLNYSQFFMPFETIMSPNHTEAMLSCTKKINKKKEELAKKYKDKLDAGDASVAEDMEKELLDYIKNELGDDPGLDVYYSGSGGNFKNNFKNMYVMKGAIRDPDPNAKQEFTIATSSFIDGISAKEYSALANSLTGGAYSRGKKTELGGYWEKLIDVCFMPIKIDKPGSDCGTDKYIEVVLTKKNLSEYIYSYIVKSNGQLEELTTDNADKYMGKKIKLRSVLFCKSKGCVCHHCAGNFFYRRGSNQIGMGVSQIATRIKLKSMKGFHDSTVSVVQIDPAKAFSVGE